TGPRDAPYDFSFSGLKTAAARWAEGHAGRELPCATSSARSRRRRRARPWRSTRRSPTAWA
ncbi:hypothetical protein ABZ372_52250, partial [Streptomyces sp. NPDC005921]